jgi:two-component system, OmpR family, phosphate regulon response regulator PhoB
MIVLAEDDKLQRHMMSELLEVWGFPIRRCPDGATALAEVTRRRPELVILDLVMPGLGGAEVLAGMRDAGLAGVPVVLATAHPDPLPELALPVTVLRKPFGVDELANLMRRLLPAAWTAAAGGGGAT